MEWLDNIYNFIIDWLEDYGVLALILIIGAVWAVRDIRKKDYYKKAGWHEIYIKHGSGLFSWTESRWVPPVPTKEINKIVEALEKQAEEIDKQKAQLSEKINNRLDQPDKPD